MANKLEELLNTQMSRRDALRFLVLGLGGVSLKACGVIKPDQAVPIATAAPKTTATAQSTETPTPESGRDLPYFKVEGVPSSILISSKDPRVANNGPDAYGIDHRNPFMPQGASWLIIADPGHYRVDNLANVTDPNVRASIVEDIRNGACFAGDDYKEVLGTQEYTVPLWESGGGAVLSGAQMLIKLTDGQGNTVVFQLGRQPNHAWIVVAANGLNRDHVKGTDANRQLHLSHYDPGFTMWQGIPPGQFVSGQFVAQTIADAHNNYRDRGTSPGQGQDGVDTVSILVFKILPEGVAYQVLRHIDHNSNWEQYRPDQFITITGNTIIQ